MNRLAWFALILAHVHAALGQDPWDSDLNEVKNTLSLLSRQIMMQQLSFEERVRSSGDSGIKIIRLNTEGTNPYMTNTYTRRSNSAIHDHSNNIRTVGMGEVVVVLNGVEFRTRHNDFRLYMKSKDTSVLDAVEDIPFPDVPQEVTNKASVQEQIDEMQLWFQAFKEQNYTVRDYRSYFKPVLCYLEGTWTYSSPDTIDEPFDSDRHHIDATSWFDLQDKIRFTSNTGTKSNLENFAFLPTTVSGLANDTTPKYAQWNYKILCHPLSRDVPLNRFRIVDDFASRMSRMYTIPRHDLSRAARYQLNPLDTDSWPTNEITYNTGLLDDLMYEIPGLDNYPANITDDAFDMVSMLPSGQSLNAGYYHRIFKTNKKGAMGTQLIHRGFHDQTLFVALNTQPKCMSVAYKACSGKGNNEVCTEFSQKASYAIPLEIIYLTPLNRWNPYNIVYHGKAGDEGAEKVKEDGRNGFPSYELAYNGTHSKIYYLTPVEFFGGNEVNRDPADTSVNFVGVLDGDGQLRNVSASGTRIFLPTIKNLGTIRTRYPINPVHDEGSNVRKELEAIKMAFLELKKYVFMMRDPLNFDGSAESITVIKTGMSQSNETSPHFHTIELNGADLKMLLIGDLVSKFTSIADGHQHYVTFKYIKNEGFYKMTMCDNIKYRCWDLHPREMYETTTT